MVCVVHKPDFPQVVFRLGPRGTITRMTAKPLTLESVGEMLTFIVEHMATKEEVHDGFASLREEMATKEEMHAGFASIREEMVSGFRDIRAEIVDLREVVEDLKEQVREHSRFTKEIDYALGRIATIEKHLGLKPLAA